jgi:hypothetical protein
MPRRVVEALLQQLLGVEMSLGSTQKCWEEASEGVALPCQELEEQLKDEPVLNVVCFGNRSATGELATAGLLTVAETCELQKLNILACLSAAIASHRRGQRSASMLSNRPD